MLTVEIRNFLAQPHFAVAATVSPDGIPHQTVIWYMLEGDELVMSTPEGSVKHRNLQRDPRLSVCVEAGFSYVTLVGSVTLASDPSREVYGRLGQRYMGSMESQPQRPAPPPDSKIGKLLSRDRVTIRMKIDRVLNNGIG